MFGQKEPTRVAPGIFSYIELLNRKFLAYIALFVMPIIIGLFAMIFNILYTRLFNPYDSFVYFIKIFEIFSMTSYFGAVLSLFYTTKAPILREPPKGWAIQLNSALSTIIGGSYLIGHVLSLFLRNQTFHEVFFILGTIVSYIVAFVIYFSFTTVGRPGYLILSLCQPVVSIIFYSFYTAQISIWFFIRAIAFFTTCALLFAVPYARGLFRVSNIYKEATGLGGYEFIRAFVLSMLTEGNDKRVETLFNRVGINSSVKIQYLAIRNVKSKKLKGLFIIPHIHFGPFKTCGSSDLPEKIYKEFKDIPGTTVFHTTNTHAQNLTSQSEVEKALSQIKKDLEPVIQDKSLNWNKEVIDFSRKISNSAKLIGMVVDRTPLLFLTRHPLPSDDIQFEVGDDVRVLAKREGFEDIIVIDSHNSIIGDEILIERNSIEAGDLINVSQKFIINNNLENSERSVLLYGVAKDRLKEYSEKDGIGYGGMAVHMFKNKSNDQKTVVVHFDGNNAFLEIRSFILNMLQNRGIEKGEITTSDSHTVARQFTRRGYSPIGDKIKIEYILQKLDGLIRKAEDDLEQVEFQYNTSKVGNVRIWGDHKYFEVIMTTLQRCIKVSQRLLTLSLILPTLFSLLLLLFYYNFPFIP
jgi:putative membrane protein